MSKGFVRALVATTIAVLCVAAQEKAPPGTYNQAAERWSQNASPADGPHIQVLILNSKSGKPVKNVWVGLRPETGNGEMSWPQSARSNSQGIAEFYFVDAIPENVTVLFDASEFASCSDRRFLTEQIIKNGIVARNFAVAEKLYASHPPLAGQLVVYGRPVTSWDRINRAIPFLQLFS